MKCYLKCFQASLNALIEVAKEKQEISQKIFEKFYSIWSLLSVFLNNKKIPIISQASSSYWCVSLWMTKRNLQKEQQTKHRKLSSSFFTSDLWLNIWKTNFNEIFSCFSANKLTSKNQCGFQTGDSCINQLLSITQRFVHLLITD